MTGNHHPANLWEIAFEVVSCHWELICETDRRGTPRRLLDHVKLPWIICDQLLNSWAHKDLLHDNAVCLFCDPRKANLKRINLSYSKITDISIMTLTNQSPLDLDLQSCQGLTHRCLPDVIKLKSLQALNLSKCPKVLQNYDYIMKFHLPHLTKLDISYTELSSVHLYLLLMQLPKLLALDVSGVVKNGDMKFLEPLQPRLTTLVLHNCIILESSLQSIYKVKTLRHLDISVAESSYAFQLTPNMLRLLIHNLPKLKYLDLSGNSLDTSDEEKKAELTENVPYFGPIDADFIEEGGGYVYEDEMVTYREETFSISKFLSNCRRTFKFLGLLHIDDEVVDSLPASKVANLSCETNILTALQMYRERKQFALVSMNAFFDTIRAVDCKQVVACVEAITSIMNTYPGDGKIQIPGSASLFHLSRNNYRMHFTDQTKQLIITALLDAIEKCRHLKNVTLLRNCGLALLNFDIPGDFCFEFERVVKNFLSVLKLKDSEGLLPRIYVYMCNSIVCHVEGDKKLLVGKLGLVECMLQLIKTGLEKRIYDEVMETAWSALWNVTDETPYNCKIFVSGDGMELFLLSLQAFPDKTDLLRNMMGLVGNVAEVPELRRQLSKHVGVFIKLLQNKSDGIEVSYNAAGTLSHIASDGPEHWIGGGVTRQDMLFHLEAAVDSWDINSQRNINYRSFQPILKLLDESHSYQVHLWASWAIANLCSVSPDKYCELLQKENGAETLENLSRRRGIPEKVKTLVNTAIRIYKNHVK